MKQNSLRRYDLSLVQSKYRYLPDTGEVVGPRGHILRPYRCGDYLAVDVSGKRIYVHRLAFLLMTGAMPDVVDHINRDPHDNRWANLLPSTKSHNANNAPGRGGAMGIKGITKHPKGYTYRYSIEGVRYQRFATTLEALMEEK